MIKDLKSSLEDKLKKISDLQKEIESLFEDVEDLKVKIYEKLLSELNVSLFYQACLIDKSNLSFIDSYTVLYEGEELNMNNIQDLKGRGLKQILNSKLENS